jgi:hypothetical protein
MNRVSIEAYHKLTVGYEQEPLQCLVMAVLETRKNEKQDIVPKNVPND